MERKEAIEILKKHPMWTGEPSEVVDVRLENKALQMAIASLETDEAYQLEYEKPEICEDCISRKEIIDRCNNVILHGVVDKEGMHPISAETLLKETESMPSVMPKATKNDCETCIHNKGVLECDMYGCKYEPTTKNDHHKQNIQAYAHDFGVSEEQAEKELRVTTKNDLAVDAEDCIDREIAIKEINKVFANYIPLLIGRCEELPLKCGKAIKNLPSVYPKSDNSNIHDKLCSYYQDGYKQGYEDSKSDNSVLEDIKAIINTPIRGTCDYFIVDEIEKYINKHISGKEEP